MIGSSIDNQFKYSSGSKRPFDAMDRDLPSEEIFQPLFYECIDKILQFLSSKQLLVFEQLNRRTSTGFYTTYRWKVICQQKKFYFDWGDLKDYDRLAHDKIRYLMGQGLTKYAFSRGAFIERMQNLLSFRRGRSQAFVKRFKDFSALSQFPSLKAYIFQDLKMEWQKESPLFSLKESQEPSFPEGSKAGDQLLKGLYYLSKSWNHLRRHPQPEIEVTSLDQFKKGVEYLEQAIQNGASLASHLAVLSTNFLGVPREIVRPLFIKLAYLSIEKEETKDYRGLCALLNFEDYVQNSLDDRRDPPLLEYRVNKAFHALLDPQKEDWEAADKGFKEAIEAYGKHVLPKTWSTYYNFKALWNRWKEEHLSLYGRTSTQEADEEEALGYLNRAIEAYGEDVPVDHLLIKSFRCKNLKTKEYAKELIKDYPSKKKELRSSWLRQYGDNVREYSCRYINYALLTYEEHEVPTSLLFAKAWNHMRENYSEKGAELFRNALAIHKERQEAPSVENLIVTADMYWRKAMLVDEEEKSLLPYRFHLCKKANHFLNLAKGLFNGENREAYFEGIFRREMMEEEINHVDESAITPHLEGMEQQGECLDNSDRSPSLFEDPYHVEDFLDVPKFTD